MIMFVIWCYLYICDDGDNILVILLDNDLFWWWW